MTEYVLTIERISKDGNCSLLGVYDTSQKDNAIRAALAYMAMWKYATFTEESLKWAGEHIIKRWKDDKDGSLLMIVKNPKNILLVD